MVIKTRNRIAWGKIKMAMSIYCLFPQPSTSVAYFMTKLHKFKNASKYCYAIIYWRVLNLSEWLKTKHKKSTIQLSINDTSHHDAKDFTDTPTPLLSLGYVFESLNLPSRN